jgi:hypothetical protein
MELKQVVSDIAHAMVHIDKTREAWHNTRHQFRPGVGPFGEPQLVKRIMKYLKKIPKYDDVSIPHLCPDLLIPDEWAIEFKIIRTFGDNGIKYDPERWALNMLNPYPGHHSVIGDCYKLLDFPCKRKAVIAIAYEHADQKDDVDLTPLLESFDAIVKQLGDFRLSQRIGGRRVRIRHRCYKRFRLFAWEVLGRANAATAH